MEGEGKVEEFSSLKKKEGEEEGENFTVKLKETRFIVNRRSYEGRTEADCSPNFHRLFY